MGAEEGKIASRPTANGVFVMVELYHINVEFAALSPFLTNHSRGKICDTIGNIC